MSLAIDRRAWREALLNGEGCLDAGPVPCGMPEWKLTADKLPADKRKYVDGYDPAEAKRLLAEAGFGRGLTTPLFHWPGFAPPWRSFYELAAENLGRVGITAELKPEEYGKFSTTTALGKFEKMAMGPFGAGETEVDTFLYENFFSTSPRNRSRVGGSGAGPDAAGPAPRDGPGAPTRDRLRDPAIPRRQGVLRLAADVAALHRLPRRT